MIVQFKPSALRQTRWYEYLIRFGLGGAMTAVAGLIAARFGPVIGGLFLAFPAIFPASVTLIEKHVRERKEKAGLPVAAALANRHPGRTVFTRFIPPERPRPDARHVAALLQAVALGNPRVP
jgi:Protein of unknown function (DUF3147)